jgi:hypothetical protein
MGQPTPPGDIPLFDGLDASWNDIVGAFPEDKRAELAPKLKERISQYEPLKQWEDFQKSGVSPDHVSTALNVFSVIENNPREVYEAIGKHLGISTQQAKEVVEEIQEGDEDDPRIASLQQQVETLAQIAIAQRQQENQSQMAAQQDAAVDKEIKAAMAKYGEVPEDELIMRMLHKGLTAEQAHQEYTGRVTEIRKTRPSPFVLGTGGQVPTKTVDVKKLDNQGTKALVAQMMEHANAENRK